MGSNKKNRRSAVGMGRVPSTTLCTIRSERNVGHVDNNYISIDSGYAGMIVGKGERKMKNRNGLERTSASNEVKREGIRYVVVNTVEAIKELIESRERGEITYEFIAMKRNGDRVFAVEGVNE